MIFTVYALFDTVRNKYMNITIDDNDEIAQRNFLEQVSQNAHLMYVAKDLVLYKIGEMNIETGLLISYPQPQMICRGSDYDKV